MPCHADYGVPFQIHLETRGFYDLLNVNLVCQASLVISRLQASDGFIVVLT